VGEPQRNFSTGKLTSPGKAYIFVKPVGGWKTTARFDAELTATDEKTDDGLGWSAAVTANKAVVGAIVPGRGLRVRALKDNSSKQPEPP
jgi:hypothetical protein